MIELKIELGVSAERIIQQLQLQNSISEEQIAKGIEEAINELTENNTLVDLVKEATKKELMSIAHKAVLSWEVQDKLQKVLSDTIMNKYSEYATSIAERIMTEIQKGDK